VPWVVNAQYRNGISLELDNDSFLGVRSDRYYTSGMSLSYFKSVDSDFIFKERLFTRRIYFVELGQKIYNTYDKDEPELLFMTDLMQDGCTHLPD